LSGQALSLAAQDWNTALGMAKSRFTPDSLAQTLERLFLARSKSRATPNSR